MIKKLLPFIVSIAVIVLDQISKMWIINNLEYYGRGLSYFNDFLRIVWVENSGVAFSFGQSFDGILKIVLFIVLPTILVVALGIIIFINDKTKEFKTYQLYCLAGIIGGGAGNLIDRITREFHVIDFISVNMYGLFGFVRFPTFNIADSAVVVSVALLLLVYLIKERKHEQKK